jgi:hypothetical protein
MIPNNLSDSLIPDILENNSNRMIVLQGFSRQGGRGGTPYASNIKSPGSIPVSERSTKPGAHVSFL